MASFGPVAVVLACDCSAVAPARALAEADAAFVGVVTGTLKRIDEPAADGANYLFLVEEVLKGQVGAEVQVSTNATDCAASFRAGERWRVYAYVDAGALTTHLCAGNQRLAEGAAPISQPAPETAGGLPSEALFGGGAFLVVVLVASAGFLLGTRPAKR
jgi:hypothetical protein